MNFQLSALDVREFSHLFGKPERELQASGVLRIVADHSPGFPCRVSLQDAIPGESLLLLNYEHQAVSSPYRSRHAILVREWAEQARPGINEIPEFLRCRMLSLRGFDAAGMLIDSAVVQGREVEASIGRLFANDSVEYLHIHNAAPGCYAACVQPLR